MREPHAVHRKAQVLQRRIHDGVQVSGRSASRKGRVAHSSSNSYPRGTSGRASMVMAACANTTSVHWQPISRVASAPAGEFQSKTGGERQMAIHVVTHRKGGSTTEVTAAVSRLKAAVLRSGAEDFRLSIELAGPEAGQWILVNRFSDMASFGRAMGAAMADPDSRAILEDLEKVSPMTSRRIVAEVDL
jgi:hypothetical protein